MLNFALPGFYELKDFNLQFIKYFQEHRDQFYDNVNIEYVYGNPQFCIWDGGRIFTQYKHTTADEVKKLIASYHELGVPIRYVFTSCTLQEQHYHDRFGNILLTLGNIPGNEIVLADDNFKDYIKEHYPNYSFVSSTTKCLTDKELVHAEFAKEDYKLVCLDYNLNHNLKFLKSFSPEEIAKTELLVNAICGPACPHRANHYVLNSISHLNYGRSYKMEGCSIKEGEGLSSSEHYCTYLNYQTLCDKYEPLGISHYKIEGRTWGPQHIVIVYCNYLAKPEYKDTILRSLICQ